MRKDQISLGILTATIACAFLLPPENTVTSPEYKSRSLASLFDSGVVAKDTNNDALADVVNATIYIAENGTAFHSAAAAEVAARLAYQTSGLSFPIVTKNRDKYTPKENISIEITDLKNIQKELDAELPAISQLLTAGRGAVISLPPKSGQKARIVITGADGPGLHHAATQFAGRWPNAWEIWGERTSTKLQQLEKDAETLLECKGIESADICLQALVYEVDEQRDKNPDLISEEKRKNLDGMLYDPGEVIAAFLRISIPTESDLKSSCEVFSALVEQHRQGKNVLLLNYQGIRETHVVMEAPAGKSTVKIPRFGLPARMLQRRPDPAAARKPKEIEGGKIDLSDLYSTTGLYTDTLKDKIPDRIETTIAIGPAITNPEVGNFAARLSLECAGVAIPLVTVDPRVDQLVKIKQPVLIGKGAGTEHLIKEGKLRPPDLIAGEGLITVIPEAFNKSSAVVVIGDQTGIDKALSFLAESYPGIRSAEPGEITVTAIKERAGQLLAGKNATGQLLYAIGTLAEELPQLKRRELAEVSIEIFLDRALPNYVEPVKEWIENNIPGIRVDALITGRRDPKAIIEEIKEFTHELEEAKKLLSENLFSVIESGSRVEIDLRISEPMAVLDDLKAWIIDYLTEIGADLDNSRIRLISAYKQGFHWLRDDVLPRLRGNDIGSIKICFRPEEPDLSQIRKFYPERTRWLSELYPIDEIFSNELDLPLNKILFEIDDLLPQTYAISVADPDGQIILSEMFTPTNTTRLYLDKFPHWAEVVSPTGWMRAIVDGKIVVDTRIKTDPERFWDYYQEEILKAAYDHVMKETGGKPTRDKQPFFNTLQIEAWLSEPDERLGIDEELVSSIEALHEDIYFDTLDFFNGMAPREGEKLPEDARYTTRLGAPGSIIPLIHASDEPQAPRVKITFLANSSSKNKVVLKWKSPEGREDSKELDLPKVEPKDVALSEIVVGEGIVKYCTVDASLPDPDTIALLADGVKILLESDDNDTGLCLFSVPGLEEVRFRLRAKAAEKTLTVPCGQTGSDQILAATIPQSEQIVPLDHIIDPDEAIVIMRMLGSAPGVTAFLSGRSYQERDIYSLEITAPTSSTHVSRAKLVTAKPSILITGRQHANEISSTIHILRLAELLATDPDYAEYRRQLNIILHPVENPDGAALVEKLIEINPYHMNHAARYTALGVELGTQHNNPDTLLTEALVRPKLWNRWLPDIYLNCHGYPSHEWVQPFGGYSPYQFRDYWIPRGWFVYVTHLDDPREPEHRKAGSAILRYIDKELTADPDAANLNERIYDRYWRWAGRWQPHVVNYELHGRTMMYWERRRSVPRKPSTRTESTVLEGTPEAMDETAQGPWLGVVVNQGLSYLKAHLELLIHADKPVEELEEESGGRIYRTLFRKRPIQVAETAK